MPGFLSLAVPEKAFRNKRSPVEVHRKTGRQGETRSTTFLSKYYFNKVSKVLPAAANRCLQAPACGAYFCALVIPCIKLHSSDNQFLNL
jgi:hypothetical protein